jgi:hypothetical protein
MKAAKKKETKKTTHKEKYEKKVVVKSSFLDIMKAAAKYADSRSNKS